MPKIRKQQRRKVYNFNRNRKRMKQTLQKTPAISCPQIKEAWDKKQTLAKNLENMGLAYDSNLSVSIPGSKPKKRINNENLSKPVKIHVAEELEKDAKAPRERSFRLPDGRVRWITYLMDRYGEDYKAMTRDKKNYYQETWKQLRAQIKQFKGIPEQYNVYLATKENKT